MNKNKAIEIVQNIKSKIKDESVLTILNGIENYITLQEEFSFYKTMNYIESLSRDRIENILLKALSRLKNDLKTEYSKDIQKPSIDTMKDFAEWCLTTQKYIFDRNLMQWFDAKTLKKVSWKQILTCYKF